MLRYKLRTLLIVLALGPMVVWIGYIGLSGAMPPETVQSPAEFNSLVESGTVIIHLDVDWSLQAIANRPLLSRLRKKVLLDPRCRMVRWRRIDCSNQQDTPVGKVLAAWIRSQNANPAFVQNGYGSLLWIKDGQLINWLSDPTFVKEERLFEKTLEAFSKG